MTDLNELPLPELFMTLTADDSLGRLVEFAREEDLGGRGDVTTVSIIEPERRTRGRLVARQAGVVAGLEAMGEVLAGFEGPMRFEPATRDGSRCGAGDVLGELFGNLRAILGVERTLLNLIGRLSGVASLTRRYVDAVDGTGAVICDTRKTTPGLRNLEKYAVRCGGGQLHRMGLYDSALYKDNHLAHVPRERLAETLSRAIRSVRRPGNVSFVEVEVDDLAQLEQVLALDEGLVDIILLDNMDDDARRRAVAMRDEARPQIALEASGGITLETVRAVAESGVERIAVGALTHSAVSLDLGLDMTAG